MGYLTAAFVTSHACRYKVSVQSNFPLDPIQGVSLVTAVKKCLLGLVPFFVFL